MESFEIVIGIHSIIEALKNKKRVHNKLVSDEEGLVEIRSKTPKDIFDTLTVEIKTSHEVQEFGKRHYGKLGATFQRIPSNIFLLTARTKIYHRDILEQKILDGTFKKMIALDKVTDVNNIGAIIRTAAFYGVDAIIFARKGEFTLNPTIIRIASGGIEHVTLFQSSNLSKLIDNLQEMGVTCVGLSENATSDSDVDSIKKHGNPICLVMGAEDSGISNAVGRILKSTLALKASGQITTLNVSVATAVVMEKFWGKQ